MKTTLKLLTATVLAAGVMASQAYAGDTVQQQRLADENAAYFQSMDKSASAKSSAAMSQPHAPVRSDTMQEGVSQYPFPGSVPSDGGYVFSPAQRH